MRKNDIYILHLEGLFCAIWCSLLNPVSNSFPALESIAFCCIWLHMFLNKSSYGGRLYLILIYQRLIIIVYIFYNI